MPSGDVLILVSLILLHLPHSLNNFIPATSKLSQQVRTQYNAAKRALVMVDNDGVLKHAQNAASPAENLQTREVIAKLAANPKNEVFVISARGLGHLKKQYDSIDNLNLAGKFGTEVQRFKGSTETTYEEFTAPTQVLGDIMLQKARAKDIKIFPGSVLFHLDKNDIQYNNMVLEEMKNLQDHHPQLKYKFETFDRYATLSHPDYNKGTLVSKLLQNYKDHDSFIMVAGDEKIDIPMFEQVWNHPYGVKRVIQVGDKDLKFNTDNVPDKVADYRAFHQFLKNLVKEETNSE